MIQSASLSNLRGIVMNLRGSVAIVTGGSGGLGGLICHSLAEAGSNVEVL